MKRLLWLLPLLLLASARPASAQLANAQGFCEAGAQPVITSGLTSTTLVQASFPQCTVSVSVHGGGTATIFSTGSSTPLSNPFTATVAGQWQFYAANGEYDITLTCSGACVPPSPSPFPVTFSDVFIENASGGGGGPTITCSTADAFLYFVSTGNLACDPLIQTNTLGELLFKGSSSGQAGIGVAAAAGTPCELLLPITSPTAGQILSSAAPSGGTCQESWTTTANGLTGTAGQSAYFSGTNAITGGAGILDMKGIAGADLGAVINTCTGTANVKECVGDNLTAAQTLSTAVTIPANVMVHFCGQSISQSAAITLSGANSSLTGCPGQPTVFTKAGNIDQITASASEAEVDWITLAGVKGSFTGNGLVTATGCTHCQFSHDTISAEANDDVRDNSGTHSANVFDTLHLTTWGVHSFESTFSTQQSTVSNSYISGDGTGTGASILDNGGTNFENNPWIADTGSQILIDSSGSSSCSIVGNRLNQSGGSTALKQGSCGATGNTIAGGGVNGQTVLLATGTLSNNPSISCSLCVASIVRVTGSGAVVSNNVLSLSPSSTTGLAAVEIFGDVLGTNVAHNTILSSDTVGGDLNYGIHLITTVGSAHMYQNTIDGNQLIATNSGGAQFWGVYLDNAASIFTEFSQNTISFNKCVHETACIVRNDPTNQTNYFIENETNNDPLNISIAGSTTDVIISESNANTTVANLPNAGNGSIIKSTSCGYGPTCNSSAGGGTGLAYRVGGVWSSTPTLNMVTVVPATAVDLTAQTANIAATTFYAVPATQAGFYRFNCYTVITATAATSGTMPNCLVLFTDKDTSTVTTSIITQFNSSNTLGSIGAGGGGTAPLSSYAYVKAGTNIQYQTTGYASSPATQLQYALHLRLEFIGP